MTELPSPGRRPAHHQVGSTLGLTLPLMVQTRLLVDRHAPDVRELDAVLDRWVLDRIPGSSHGRRRPGAGGLGRRPNAMKRTWTIIGVRDVPGRFKWYQSLFGQPEMPPGDDDFGQILIFSSTSPQMP